jgi:hypothetical protein
MKNVKAVYRFMLIIFVILSVQTAKSIDYNHSFNPVQGLVNDVEKPFRSEMCINGKWKFMPLYNVTANDFNFPLHFDWELTDIKIPSPWNVNDFTDKQGGDFITYPSYPEKWKDAKIGWMQKTVEIPVNWNEKQLKLHFEGIMGKARIYVNRKLVAENFELFLPVEIDVTNFLRPGERNEILVGVAKPNLFDIQGKYGRRTYVGGSMWGTEMAGIWQDVYLFAYPKLFVQDVFVQPDVKNNILKLVVTIQNNSSQIKNITLSGAIKKWVNLAGKQLSEIPEQKGRFEVQPTFNFPLEKLSIGPNSILKLTIEKTPDTKLEFWTPTTPNLYGAEVSILENKSCIDKKVERFGWRQFTTENGKLQLNGKQITLKGDSWHFTGVPQMTRRYAWAWFNMLKDANANAVRLHAEPFPQFYLDMADEMGICVLDETGIWSSDGGPKIDSDEYWVSCESHLKKLINRDKNHPSIFGWSVCNETVPVVMHVFKAPESLVQKQLCEINKWVSIAKEMDPTRSWISGDGETDRPTDLPILIGHYGDENTLKNWSSQGKVWGVGETSMAYYGTPKQVSKINGNRAYESMLGRMEGIAQESYELLKMQRSYGAAYTSVFNLVWYALQPMPLGLKDISHAPKSEDGIFFGFQEGIPGMQPERLGPYTTTLNPGYDNSLPLYRTWPMFDAIHAANADSIQCYNIIKKSPEPAQFKIMARDNIKVFGSNSSILKVELIQLGLKTNEKKKLTAKSMIIIDGKNPPVDSKMIAEIKNGLVAGARVLVWGVDLSSIDALNNLLPYKLELSERKATSFLKMKDVPMLQGLNHADFYFSELLSRGKTAMNFGLGGDFVSKAQTYLEACGTEWQCWNYNAETTKTANVFRSELETIGSKIVVACANYNSSDIIVSSFDFNDIRQESDVIVRIMLSNLGAQFNGNGASNMKAVDEIGKLHTALICGAFNTTSGNADEMLEYDFTKNDKELNPQLGTSTDDKRWVIIKANKKNIFNIRNAQISGSNENAAVYLSFWLFSPRSLVNLLAEPDMPKLDMIIGAENGYALNINGKRFSQNVTDKFIIDGDKIENLPLEKGWNHLILKIVRGSGEGNWNLNARFESNNPEYLKQMHSSVSR